MYECVNPNHPDKQADRIAGALTDLAYSKNDNPQVAIEVLLGHGKCHIINETDTHLTKKEVKGIVKRIAGNLKLDYKEVPQDVHLAKNQSKEVRCGDNGIFKGVPVTKEQINLTNIARIIYKKYPYDGKYILDDGKLVICQSNAPTEELREMYPDAIINPLGDWTGGSNVDCGATNRKLGSDMGDSVTGGGLMGKNTAKADVSINIYVFAKAQAIKRTVTASCAIGDTEVIINLGKGQYETVPYATIVAFAKQYIKSIGGFEKFAEWGLIR